MGNENVVPDPNVSVFLQLKSLIYKPGQTLKGSIYLEAKQYSHYSELVLTLECFEKTERKDKRDKNGETLIEERKTYFEQMKVAEFMNGLYQGQHQFPFRLKIPSEFPGTLVLSINDYIRYKITAYLQSSSPQKTNQLHSRQIWIIEKFRAPIQPIFSLEQQEPKCCMFGYSWGWIKTEIECEFNCIQPGQKFKLKFEINTHRMNTKVKCAKIRLVEKIFSATNQFSEEKQVNQLFAFDFNQNVIEKGQIIKMEKYIVLPLDLFPTAIGQILSRFYVIEIHLMIGCYGELKRSLHVFVESDKNGLAEENKPFPKPKNWKPHKYQKLEFDRQKKYEYKAHSRLFVRNELKTEINKFQVMRTTQFGSERKLNL